MRNVHKFLVGKPGRKRPLGRCSGWEGITKTVLEERGY
jgi:hypothetical protein